MGKNSACRISASNRITGKRKNSPASFLDGNYLRRIFISLCEVAESNADNYLMDTTVYVTHTKFILEIKINYACMQSFSNEGGTQGKEKCQKHWQIFIVPGKYFKVKVLFEKGEIKCRFPHNIQ